MSAREIIAELPRLTVAELHAVEQRIVELTSLRTTGASHPSAPDNGLHTERIGGRLVFVGSRIIRQTEVESILDEFP
jgi:hypothetical protein